MSVGSMSVRGPLNPTLHCTQVSMDSDVLSQQELLDKARELYALHAALQGLERDEENGTTSSSSVTALPPIQEDGNVDLGPYDAEDDASILDLIMKMKDAQDRTLELEKEAARLTALRDSLVAKMEGLESEGTVAEPSSSSPTQKASTDLVVSEGAAEKNVPFSDDLGEQLLYPEILPFLQSEVAALGEAAERLLSSGDMGEESLATLALIKERMTLLEKLENLAHMEAELSLLEEQQLQEAGATLPSILSLPAPPLDAIIPSLASLSHDTQAACILARLAVVKSLAGGLGGKGEFSDVMANVFEGLDGFEKDDSDLAATLSFLTPGAPPPLYATHEAILAVFRCGIRTALSDAAAGLTGEVASTRELAQLPPSLLLQLTETRAFGDSFRGAMMSGLLGGIPLADSLLAKGNPLVEQPPSVVPSPPPPSSFESHASLEGAPQSLASSIADNFPSGASRVGIPAPSVPAAKDPRNSLSSQTEPWFVRLTHHRQGKVRGAVNTVAAAPPPPPSSPPKGEGRSEFRVFSHLHPLSHFAPPDGPSSLEIAQAKGVVVQSRAIPVQSSSGGEPWWSRMTHHRTRTTILRENGGQVSDETKGVKEGERDGSGSTEDITAEDVTPVGATRSQWETFAAARDGPLRGSGTKVAMSTTCLGSHVDYSPSSPATAFNLEATQHSASGIDLAPFFIPNGSIQFTSGLGNEGNALSSVFKAGSEKYEAQGKHIPSVNATRRLKTSGRPLLPSKKLPSGPLPAPLAKSLSVARQTKANVSSRGTLVSEAVPFSRGISVHTLADGVPGGLGTAHTHHVYHGKEKGGKWLHVRRPPPPPSTRVIESSVPPTQAPYLVSSLAHSAGLTSFPPSVHTRVWWHAPLPVPVPSSSGKVAETAFTFKEWGSDTAPLQGAPSFTPNPVITSRGILYQALESLSQIKHPSHFSSKVTTDEVGLAVTTNRLIEAATTSNVATAASSVAESTMLSIAPSSFLNAPRRGPLSSLSPLPYDSPVKRAHDVSQAGIHHMLTSKDISFALLPTPKGDIPSLTESSTFLKLARASFPPSGSFSSASLPPSSPAVLTSQAPTLLIANSDIRNNYLGEDAEGIAASISQARRRADRGVVSEGGGAVVPRPKTRRSSDLLLNTSLWPLTLEGAHGGSDISGSSTADVERVAVAIGKARLRSATLSLRRSASEGGGLGDIHGCGEGVAPRPSLHAAGHDRGDGTSDSLAMENWMALSISAARSRAKRGVSSSLRGCANFVDTAKSHPPTPPPTLTDPLAFPSLSLTRGENTTAPLLSGWEEEHHETIVLASDKAKQRILMASSRAESSDAFSSAHSTLSAQPAHAGGAGAFDGGITPLYHGNVSNSDARVLGIAPITASLAQHAQHAPLAPLYEQLVAASNFAQNAAFHLAASSHNPKDYCESLSEYYTDDFEEEEGEEWGEGEGVGVHVQVTEVQGDDVLCLDVRGKSPSGWTKGLEGKDDEDSIEAALEARLVEAAHRRSLR